MKSPAPWRSGPLRPTESDPVKLYSQDFLGLVINFPTAVSQQETFGIFLHLFVSCPVAFQNQSCGSSVTFTMKITPSQSTASHIKACGACLCLHKFIIKWRLGSWKKC